MNEQKLLSTTDAQVWADQFVSTWEGKKVGEGRLDSATMIGWFANAMEVARSAEVEAREEAERALARKQQLLTNLVVAVDRYVDCDDRPRPLQLWQAMTGAAGEASSDVYPLGSEGRPFVGPLPEILLRRCLMEWVHITDGGTDRCGFAEGHHGPHKAAYAVPGFDATASMPRHHEIRRTSSPALRQSGRTNGVVFVIGGGDEPVSERPEPIGGEHGPLHNSTGLATGWVRVECDCGWQSDPVPGVLAEMSVYAEHVTDRLRARLVEAEKVVDVCRQICDTGEAIPAEVND